MIMEKALEIFDQVDHMKQSRAGFGKFIHQMAGMTRMNMVGSNSGSVEHQHLHAFKNFPMVPMMINMMGGGLPKLAFRGNSNSAAGKIIEVQKHCANGICRLTIVELTPVLRSGGIQKNNVGIFKQGIIPVSPTIIKVSGV